MRRLYIRLGGAPGPTMPRAGPSHFLFFVSRFLISGFLVPVLSPPSRGWDLGIYAGSQGHVGFFGCGHGITESLQIVTPVAAETIGPIIDIRAW